MAQAPHRSPESWQKHWDAYPDAPERLLKEATLSWTVVRAPMGRKSRVSVVPASAEDSEEDYAEGDGEMDEQCMERGEFGREVRGIVAS